MSDSAGTGVTNRREHFSRAIHSEPYNVFFIADSIEETWVLAVRSVWREGGNP